MVRKPAVAGTFYAGNRDSLLRQIEECFRHPLGPGTVPETAAQGERKIVGLINPHAGYMYSGAVAAWGFGELIKREKPETVIILGPNHRGFGSPLAIMSEGAWKTPLGEVQINTKVASQLLDSLPSILEDDAKAHEREHSLEVQLPFLQYGYGSDFKIVPLCMAEQTYTTSTQIGRAILELLKENPNLILVASTDLTHYQPQHIAEKEDRKIIEAILSGNPRNLNKLLMAYDFSMCGPGPVMVVMEAICSSGLGKAKLLKYATSGNITGDYSAVVGYASLILERNL